MGLTEGELVDLQYDRQQGNIDRQNEWQSAENAIDRQFQAEQWMRQFQAEVNQQNKMFNKESERWQEQFNMQNEYNAPQAQVQRLMAAGINPAALASSLSSGNSSANLGASTGASSPSGGSPSSHGVSPVGLGPIAGVSSDAAMFSSISQLADSVNKLGSSSVSGYATMKTLDSEIKNKVADTNLKDVTAAYQVTLNNLKKEYGGSELSASIQKLNADAYAAYSRGDYDTAAKKYTEALDTFTRDENARKNEAFPLVCASMRKSIQLMESERSRNFAQANQANSQAALNNALTSTENSLREGRVEALDLSNQLLGIQKQLQGRENIRDAATHLDKISAIVAQCERQGIITEQTRQQVQKMMVDNDWNNVEHFFGVLGSAVGSVASGASAYGNIKQVEIGQVRNEVQREFNNNWIQQMERSAEDKAKGHLIMQYPFNN